MIAALAVVLLLGACSAGAEEVPLDLRREFRTDWTRSRIPFGQVLSGGPPRDGIPSVDRPLAVGVDEADGWLEDREPVLVVELEGATRIYPLQILMWHEIVNDTLGGVPLAVTYCPLCNTGVVYLRTVGGRVLDFGTTGRLRFSNLLMYDRPTHTWWQQATGEALIGRLAGERLVVIPSLTLSWAEARRLPGAEVLSRDTGHQRDYGRNPYVGYDAPEGSPFLFRGPATPKALSPLQRVATIDRESEAVAYPYSTLERVRVVNDNVGGSPVAVFWRPGVASALDTARLATGRDVGAAAAYVRVARGRTLTFRWKDGRLQDEQTGSLWSPLGVSLSGPLEGSRLEPVAFIDHFWFSWAAFRPDTRIWSD
jgi:hypothetical protein